MGTSDQKIEKYSHVINYLSHKRAKKSCSNTLYFGLHKNNKHVDLSMYILNV
jgi:hypothetical protein